MSPLPQPPPRAHPGPRSRSGAGYRAHVGAGTEVEAQDRVRTRHAPRVRVLLHDDPETPMDFVVEVLRGIFGLDGVRSRSVMYEAHRSGVALVEVVPFETAEWHVERAHRRARGAGYPLTFSIEPE